MVVLVFRPHNTRNVPVSSPLISVYPNLSLFHAGFERFASFKLPSDISDSHGENYEQHLLWRCDSD